MDLIALLAISKHLTLSHLSVPIHDNNVMQITTM